MRVLAVSIAPVFNGVVHGGSQRMFLVAASALGEAGHEVRILCSRRPENVGGSRPSPGVSVEPSLLLRGTFPSPYEVAPYRLAQTAAALKDAAGWADRIYLHADAVFMRHLLGDRPLVRALHDFVYEEALLSAFSLPAALTVVPSEYLRRCIEAAVRRTGARELEPVRVIPNGIELPARPPRPAPPTGVTRREPGDIILLYPHRPDPRKGIRESLDLVGELRHRRPKARVRLLVASHLDEKVSEEAASYRGAVMAMAREAGVAGSVEFHPWAPYKQMGRLYAFGDATLCIGNFIEAFGLVPLESVAAGTPAICARVGALRELEGLPGLRHVPYGDTPAAADAAEGTLADHFDRAEARSVIADRYSFSRMQAEYAEAIAGPLPPGLDQGDSGEGSKGGTFELAPWCHIEGGRIYNDYEYGYAAFPALVRFLKKPGAAGRPFTPAHAAASGVQERELSEARARGVIVPA